VSAMRDAEKVVCEIIAKITKRDLAEVLPELKLAEDLGMKSVSRIELAALLEDRLGITVDNFEIRKPKTVGHVVDMVQAKL
jgi:acyl carrier protein